MRIIGQQRVSDLFGVSRETIDTWQQLGFPVAMRGGPGVPSEYESDACIRWLVERELSKVQPETPSNRLALAKAQAVEMDNAERRKQLIRADMLEPRLKAAAVAARGIWQDEPARLAREAEGKTPQEVEDMLAVAFNAFLVRLSQWPHVAEGDPAE
jgi:phage terminase Nu1 subunit (DNA packaging protein)